jgi:hypothetical protein
LSGPAIARLDEDLDPISEHQDNRPGPTPGDRELNRFGQD